MGFLGRTNLVASLKLLHNQPLLAFTSVRHLIQPLCAGCVQRQMTQFSCSAVQQRHQHTAVLSGLDDMSTWQRIKWNMGFYGKLAVPNRYLLPSGYNLYICCTDFIDFAEFVKVLNLPDTFNSWFLLLQLHMWMVNVKVSQMGREGILLKQHVYRAMWDNVEKRLEKFQDMSGSERREAMKNFYSLMMLSIMYYDEGLLGSDKTLANSLWVQLFAMDPNIEANQLEHMVGYVRKQVHHHDHLDPYPIMKPGYISFLPLIGDQLDQKKAERDFKLLTSA